MEEELVEKEGVEGDDEKIKVHNMKTSPVNFHFKLQVIFDCREGKMSSRENKSETDPLNFSFY